MDVFAKIERALLAQRGHLLLWVPVSFGSGIGLYFSLLFEPSFSQQLLVLGGMTATAILSRLVRTKSLGTSSILLGFVILALGFQWSALRTYWVTAPRLEYRYYGPIQGRVVAIDRSASDAIRLTLDHVILSKMSSNRTPKRVRISLHGTQDWYQPKPFQWVGTTGHLSPPSGPVEPEGFDFQRHVWFLRLGAVGYTRVPVLELRSPPEKLRVLTLRHRISQLVQMRLSGDTGGFAAAVTTGDRSGISQTSLTNLRVTNLAHLLAISGLHMGLLVSFVFAAIRIGFALFPGIALRNPVKKIAAIGALFVATGYLLLSGASVATERAFVMAAVALVAVMLDRRALSLRAVAVAAMIVLLMRPESILSPGFQMSFAATTVLVGAFGAMRGRLEMMRAGAPRMLVTLVLSSFVAGAATAPYAAAHFNQWATYGLPANLLSVSVMGFVVIPAAVLAVLLAPLGLENIGLTIMGWGLDWILGVAAFFANLDGARLPIVAPPSTVLPLLTLGALLVIIWQGHGRYLGAIPIYLSLWLWGHTERPSVLIAETGALVGVMSATGRIISHDTGQGFVADNWLENDGDSAEQTDAALRGGERTKNGLFKTPFAQGYIWHIRGKRAAAEFQTCAEDDILVTAQKLSFEPKCLLIDLGWLRQSGALALYETPQGIKTISVTDQRGQRPWSTKPPKAAPKNNLVVAN